LAEIAVEEERWNDAEEYFLRALYADPTNAHVNAMYGESLVARGRVRDALHYMLEAYRYEPAAYLVNFRVSMAAGMAGDGDLALKHATIFGELMGDPKHPWALSLLADGHLLKGETDRALEILAEEEADSADWYLDCFRVRNDPSLAPGVFEVMRETLEQYLSGTLEGGQYFSLGAQLADCAIQLGKPDIVFDILFAEDMPGFEGGMPTEVIFITMFITMFAPDGGILRKHPRFRELVVETGLLEYWRRWGWSDYCKPDGDSFSCD